MENPKSILITGATGSIGSALVKRLWQTGQTVRVLVRNPDRAAKLQRVENVEIFLGDLSQPDSLCACARKVIYPVERYERLTFCAWEGKETSGIVGKTGLLQGNQYLNRCTCSWR